MNQQWINLFVELLNMTSTFALVTASLALCWNFISNMRYGMKVQSASVIFKVTLSYGACSCGWYYLLLYKDIVQPHFQTLAIILAIITALATIYIIIVIYKYFRRKK